jgi:hypothetical protein
MLALVSHMFIQIQNGDIFASPNHRDVLPTTKFAPLILLTINVLPTAKSLSMSYPLKNNMWFFSGQHTDSKISKPARFTVWFSHSNWVLMEHFPSYWLKQSIWSLFCTINIFPGICIQMEKMK